MCRRGGGGVTKVNWRYNWCPVTCLLCDKSVNQHIVVPQMVRLQYPH